MKKTDYLKEDLKKTLDVFIDIWNSNFNTAGPVLFWTIFTGAISLLFFITSELSEELFLKFYWMAISIFLLYRYFKLKEDTT